MRGLCHWLLLLPVLALAQPAEPLPGEVSFREEPVSFRVRVNVVMVPVVVRDSKGRCIGNLGRDDFGVFDRGKAQPISSFAVERRIRGTTAARRTPTPLQLETGTRPPAPAPGRYVAYFLDDINPEPGDLMQARAAALQYIKTALEPTDRAAILTSSGRVSVDFTDDLAALEKGLLSVQRMAPSTPGCPDLSRLLAERIENEDGMALGVAVQETMSCMNLPREAAETAVGIAKAKARQVLADTGMQVRLWFDALNAMVRRMSVLPGQRMVVIASPGFTMVPEDHTTMTESVNFANRSKVMIGALDVRGLYGPTAIPTVDRRALPIGVEIVKARYRSAEVLAQADVLSGLAEGTGGRFIENTNDLEGAFGRLADAPEYVYMLGFSPGDIKPDGEMHKLTVRLRDGKGLTVQARRSYYAARRPADPAEAAKQDIQDAMFSRSEVRDLPVELHTQYSRTGDNRVKVTVVARIALKDIELRKNEGRNRNDLTVVSGLFDRNGNLVAATQKLVEIRLFDSTLERTRQSSITIRTSFDVAPGSYAVRLVARDAEAQFMAAENGSVEIP